MASTSRLSLVGTFLFFFTGCNEATPEEEITTEEIEVTNCDCNDLAFDQRYNNFYLEKPRNGYTGSCEIYFGNGNLSTVKHFEKGKLHGEMITYHENGQVAERKSFDKNLQTGDYFIYTESGELVSHSKFERGRFVETIFPAP